MMSPLLLPKREPMICSVVADPREYVVSVRVDSRYAHIGKMRRERGENVVEPTRSSKPLYWLLGLLERRKRRRRVGDMSL